MVRCGLTECGVEPIAESKQPPVNFERLVMDIDEISPRRDVKEQHERSVCEGQHRQIDVDSAFDAGPVCNQMNYNCC